MKIKSTFNRTFWIGLSCIGALIMIYFGLNFLKGKNIFKKQNTYVAVFDDVTGLNISSPIFVNGYQIGIVKSINIISPNPISFAVVFDLDHSYQIPKGSSIDFGADLLGASIANLRLNEKATEYHQPGDTILGLQKKGMMDDVARVIPKADTVLLHIDSVVVNLNKLLSNPVWEKTILGIGSTVNELDKSSKHMNAILFSLRNDLPGLTHNLTAVSGDLKDVTAELKTLELQKTFAAIDSTVENLKILSSKLNSSDNSLGKLTTSTELHDSLTNTINSAAKLLENIKENPERYLNVRVRLF